MAIETPTGESPPTEPAQDQAQMLRAFFVTWANANLDDAETLANLTLEEQMLVFKSIYTFAAWHAIKRTSLLSPQFEAFRRYVDFVLVAEP